MARVKQKLEAVFKTQGKSLFPAVVCKYNGKTVTCISHGYVDPKAKSEYLAAFGDTIPSLSVLLNLHSQKGGGIELGDIKDADDENCYIAVCGYPPTISDFGMAYRNNMRFVLDLAKGEFWRVNQNTPDTPNERVALLEEEKAKGHKILDAEWEAGGKGFSLVPDDLYGVPWFKKFLTPDIGTVKVPKYYQEEITKEAQTLGKFEASYQWSDHKGVTPGSSLWWTLIALYTNFAWGSQLPCYRSGSATAQPPSGDAFKQGSLDAGEKRLKNFYVPFLDGLNVSGLLLDPTMKPLAWSVNTNKINKTHHAETALILAWLQGNPKKQSFEGYTFISPWRPCCMCSAWIADVFRGCKVVWFIDDPGLPLRHLDFKVNKTEEIFLPDMFNKMELASVVKRDYPWFGELGAATYWNYNANYIDKLRELVGGTQEKIGPVELFKSEKYFDRLTRSWESTRHLSSELLQTLTKAGQLESYVNNIWALRRCILAFDESVVV